MQMSCGLVSGLQWGAAGAAFVAAGLWFAASLVSTGPLTYETDKFLGRLKLQSTLNAVAALFAAGAAIIQGILVLAPTCIGLK
jgi:hypothetical protein